VTSVITNWQSSARGCFKTSLTHPSIREVKYHTNQYWIRERIDHLSLFQCFICTLIYYCHIKYQLSLLRSTVGINVSSERHEVSANLILFLCRLIWKANFRFLSSCLSAAKDRRLTECIKGDFWETKTRIREEGRKAAAGHISRVIVPHVSVNPLALELDI